MNNNTVSIPQWFEEWISKWLFEKVVSPASDFELHNAKVTWARAIARAAYIRLSEERGGGTTSLAKFEEWLYEKERYYQCTPLTDFGEGAKALVEEVVSNYKFWNESQESAPLAPAVEDARLFSGCHLQEWLQNQLAYAEGVRNYGSNAKEVNRFWDGQIEAFKEVLEKIDDLIPDSPAPSPKEVSGPIQQEAGIGEFLNLHKRLIGELNEYVVLLSAELDELAGMAYSHGRRSKRYETGKSAREKIQSIVDDIKKFEAQLSAPSPAEGVKEDGWIGIEECYPNHYRVDFKDSKGKIYKGNFSKSSSIFYAYGISEPIESVTHWRLQTEDPDPSEGKEEEKRPTFDKLPEDTGHWLRDAEDKYSHVSTDQESYRAGAIDMYWKHCHGIDNPTRLSFVKFAYGCMKDRDKLAAQIEGMRKDSEGMSAEIKALQAQLEEARKVMTSVWTDPDFVLNIKEFLSKYPSTNKPQQ